MILTPLMTTNSEFAFPEISALLQPCLCQRYHSACSHCWKPVLSTYLRSFTQDLFTKKSRYKHVHLTQWNHPSPRISIKMHPTRVIIIVALHLRYAPGNSMLPSHWKAWNSVFNLSFKHLYSYNQVEQKTHKTQVHKYSSSYQSKLKNWMRQYHRFQPQYYQSYLNTNISTPKGQENRLNKAWRTHAVNIEIKNAWLRSQEKTAYDQDVRDAEMGCCLLCHGRGPCLNEPISSGKLPEQ